MHAGGRRSRRRAREADVCLFRRQRDGQERRETLNFNIGELRVLNDQLLDRVRSLEAYALELGRRTAFVMKELTFTQIA